jgi:hypothetical protein
MPTAFPSIIALSVAAAILFLIYLLLRELNCWYFKINEIVSLLKELNSRLPKSPSQDSRYDAHQAVPDITVKIDGDQKAFVRRPSEAGEAFCLGCRRISPIRELLYNKKTDSYYHSGCLPK